MRPIVRARPVTYSVRPFVSGVAMVLPDARVGVLGVGS